MAAKMSIVMVLLLAFPMQLTGSRHASLAVRDDDEAATDFQNEDVQEEPDDNAAEQDQPDDNAAAEDEPDDNAGAEDEPDDNTGAEDQPDDSAEEQQDDNAEEQQDDNAGAEAQQDDNAGAQEESADNDAPASFMGNFDGTELVSDDDEGTTIFRADEKSELVEKENERNQNAEVKSVFEIRTKLTFNSNRKTLKNPEMVERIVADIKEQQEQLPDLKFVFCLHVGTTAVEKITQTRPGFMEGRAGSVKDALQPDGAIQGVSGVIANEFLHFECSRFAGLVMKAYAGESAPECTHDDLTPPGN